MIKRITLALSASLAFTLFPMTAGAHTRCDSLANAATAAGGFWLPLGGFQVGYYGAKFIDEEFLEYGDPDRHFRCNELVLDSDAYASLWGDPTTDRDERFKFVWDGAGELIESARDLGAAISEWNDTRERLLDAQMAGDEGARVRYETAMDEAHVRGMRALQAYRDEHLTFAETLADAADLLEQMEVDYRPMTVEQVVEMSRAIANGAVPDYEYRYLTEVVCLDPDLIDADGVLAPAARFAFGDVAPDTFMSDEDLVTASTLYRRISGVFGTEVVGQIDDKVPADFIANEPLPWDGQVIEEERDEDSTGEMTCSFRVGRDRVGVSVAMLIVLCALRSFRRRASGTWTRAR